MAFGADRKRLLTGSEDRTARLWDAATGRPSGLLLEHASTVVDVAFSPDGRRMLTGNHDKTARFWDTSTGRPVGPPVRFGDTVAAAAFGPAGDRVLTGGYDESARLWELYPPLQDSPDRVVGRLAGLTGMELREDGVVHMLGALPWQVRRQQLAGR